MKIKEDLKMMFTNIQCKDKFKGMVKNCKVSIVNFWYNEFDILDFKFVIAL